MINVQLVSLSSKFIKVYDSTGFESNGTNYITDEILVYDNLALYAPYGMNTTELEFIAYDPHPNIPLSLFSVGDIVVFTQTGYSAPISEVIINPRGYVDIVLNGTPPKELYASKDLLYPPNNNLHRFRIYRKINKSERYSIPSGGGGNKMYTVTDSLVDASCISSAEDGFVRASLSLRKNSLNKEIVRSDITDWHVLITSEHGVVWEGYVVSAATSDDIVSIECSGYKSKLADVFYAGYFPDKIEISPQVYRGVSQTEIIKDILTTVSEFIDSTDLSIDRDKTLWNYQTQVGAEHTVGPKDYTSTSMTAKAALDDILGMGAYGTTDISSLVVQFLDSKKAVTKIIKPVYYASDAQWIIQDDNFLQGSEKSFTLDRSNFYNGFFVSFKLDNGGEGYSLSKYQMRDIETHGIKEKMISGGNISNAEMSLVVEVEANKITNTGVIGDIEVVGNVRNTVKGFPVPVYMIRGGDIVYLPGYDSSTVPFSVNSSYGSTFMAGEVECNLIQGTAKITPYNHPEQAELVINQLDVG